MNCSIVINLVVAVSLPLGGSLLRISKRDDMTSQYTTTRKRTRMENQHGLFPLSDVDVDVDCS
jgi:hypothetical protein